MDMVKEQIQVFPFITEYIPQSTSIYKGKLFFLYEPLYKIELGYERPISAYWSDKKYNVHIV